VFTHASFAEVSPTYAIVNCTIVPVKGPKVDNGAILIRNGLIEAIGPKAQIVLPEEAEIIEAE
jgi:imidazolonepropionase-like amidohydrolase